MTFPGRLTQGAYSFFLFFPSLTTPPQMQHSQYNLPFLGGTRCLYDCGTLHFVLLFFIVSEKILEK